MTLTPSLEMANILNSNKVFFKPNQGEHNVRYQCGETVWYYG